MHFWSSRGSGRRSARSSVIRWRYGSDGRIKCELRIGCAIGRGGSAVAAGGDPTYCEVDYTGADYQQFTGRTVLFDTSVGYQPPLADPNDDGINFLSPLAAEDVIDIPLAVVNPPSVQVAYVWSHSHWDVAAESVSAYDPANAFGPTAEELQAMVTARADSVNNALKQVETKATFKLKNMSREFSSDYEIAVS